MLIASFLQMIKPTCVVLSRVQLTVIEEAIRYIDELHSKLAERLFAPSGIDKSTGGLQVLL